MHPIDILHLAPVSTLVYLERAPNELMNTCRAVGLGTN